MPQPCFTAGQLLQAVQTDAPLLLLISVDVSARSDGLGLPCRVLGTIAQGVGMPAAPAAASDGQESRIVRMLAMIGVPSNLLGYDYLRTALTVMLQQPDMGHGLTRALYPEVARQHGTTARCVERAIRHAIGQTWARGGGADYARLLGRMGSTVGDRPTNSEFLAQVAEGIRLDAMRSA